jgi:hypothetical protein
MLVDTADGDSLKTCMDGVVATAIQNKVRDGVANIPAARFQATPDRRRVTRHNKRSNNVRSAGLKWPWFGARSLYEQAPQRMAKPL